MSVRPTGAQTKGSVDPVPQAIWQGPRSHYVEFYLATIWTWTDAGRMRLRKFMENLNVDHATYSFDTEFQAVKVRCSRDSDLYICRKFLQLVRGIEDEYRNTGETADAVQKDRILTDLAHHPDVKLPVSVPNTRRLPADQISKSITSGSVGDDSSQNSGPVISLVVPEELRDSLHIAVWQDLQARNKNFEGTCFISPAAKAAIESAHDVRIIVDIAQKVVFIGSSASSDAAEEVKARLTRLLQHYQSSRKLPSIPHHVFYVESPTVWTIDNREISQINPVLALSTIIDPWKYPVPEQYDLFHGDAGVFTLRICMEEPLRYGQHNKTWSLFGPRAQNVFNGRPAQRSSRFFGGLRAARRPRAPKQQPAAVGIVGDWLQKLTDVPTAFDRITIPSLELDVITQTPILGVGADDPIPLHFDPSRRLDPTLDNPGRSSFHGGSDRATMKPHQMTLLDQQDAVLCDPSSTLQRAMKPSQKSIMVPDPDLTELEPSQQCKLPSQSSVDQSGGEIRVADVNTSDKKELSIFTASIGRLMGHMRSSYGLVSLRAELGRYYAYNVPTSGRAVNQQNEPAWGWEPDGLREKMDQHLSFMFTKALTCWGTDVDFLVGKMWELASRSVFFDFHFQATLDNTLLDMVLEVNAEDYTWRIRFLDNVDDVIYVHCLAQHWDFQVPLTCDRSLEYRGSWAEFAEALIESLDVKPPELEFQHTFSEVSNAGNGSPVVIQDVRARQTCRFRHQDQKTYLDIDRILPTKAILSSDPRYHKVRGALTKSSVNNPSAGDDPVTGEFAQWFEASVSSVRLEELLQQNQVLVPGDEVDWTVHQIEQEQL